MDSHCRQTLEALDRFLQQQRTLLERTRDDIEYLKHLRKDKALSPLSGNSQALGDYPRLSNYAELNSSLPEDVEWSVFTSHDLTPLKSLTLSLEQSNIRGKEPAKTQCSELSYLQKFVKFSRQVIIDPVLPEHALHLNPEENTDKQSKITADDLRRQQEHHKIRELKSRKVRFSESSLSLCSHASDDHVYVRRDVGDESAEVDIANDDESRTAVQKQSVDIISSTEGKAPLNIHREEPPSTELSKTFRSRPSTMNGKTKRSLSPGSSSLTQPPPKRTRENGKPKSETYKMAWTDSEQNLLERLLDEIPAGEKNRWAKISRAMNGRRTPKQVASRVQKYFEKLKKFGIE